MGARCGRQVLSGGGGNGERMLTEDDLALVRQRLRDAAQHSNLRAAAAAEADQAKLASAELLKVTGKRDAVTCAAAIETLLWFGLALGEPPRPGGDRPDDCAVGSAVKEISLGQYGDALDCADLLGFDFGSAMAEAGIEDEAKASAALAAVRAVDAERDAERTGAIDTLSVRSEDSLSSSASTADTATPAQSPLRRGAIAAPRGAPPLNRFDTGGLSDAGSEDSHEAQASQTEQGGEAADEQRPRADDASGARRSSRAAKPTRKWKEAEEPLLKWEKEQRTKSKPPPPSRGGRAAGGKRRADAADTYDTESNASSCAADADAWAQSAKSPAKFVVSAHSIFSPMGPADLSIDGLFDDDTGSEPAAVHKSKRRHVGTSSTVGLAF